MYLRYSTAEGIELKTFRFGTRRLAIGLFASAHFQNLSAANCTTQHVAVATSLKSLIAITRGGTIDGFNRRI